MISKAALATIKKIVDRNYHSLLLRVSGPERRLLDLVYYSQILNDPESKNPPTTIVQMEAQLKSSPLSGGVHDSAVDHLNSTLSTLIEKLKTNVQGSIEGVVRNYNLDVRNKLIQGLKNPPESIAQLKTKLRDIAKSEGRNFKRIAVTETSNAMGMGSVDRVVAQNKGADLGSVYVYRIITPDAATCRWCRRFYQDNDGTPAVYRLSTLLSNGTNYGKSTSEWLPVVGATHPNERCSGLIQLKRGWKVQPGGKLDFVGLVGWETYIESKIRS